MNTNLSFFWGGGKKFRVRVLALIAYHNFREKDLRELMTPLSIFLSIEKYNYNS